jgi:hypothetical protein
MYRRFIVVAVAFAMVVGVIGSGSTRSLALEASPTPPPTPPTEVCDGTETDHWEDEIDVQPFGASDALVRPLDSADQDLYLVVWTIRPGTCIPYTAAGNQKDGAIVLIVQDGVVEYTAEPYVAGSVAEVQWGHTTGDSDILDFGVTQTLYSGDWVTQNDQVWFTLRAIGGESAVVLKAVWAKPPIEAGCSGGCK